MRKRLQSKVYRQRKNDEKRKYMNWKKLFAPHILERGYGYYLEDAVENMKVSAGCIKADVYGTDDYEVEITLHNDSITDMYCSCPYAEDGNNCKHMAAVLYEWSEGQYEIENAEGEDNISDDLFVKPFTKAEYDKRYEAVKKLVEEADIEVVRSYLTSILCDDEKLFVRFHSMIQKNMTDEDVERYIRQVDNITNRYLGRENFISYYDADGFISELEDILDEDVQRMIDNGNYMSAFKLINYIFVLIGNVDMDDSDGGTGMLADQIYQIWLKLLDNVENIEKQAMFQWFVTHLDGTIIDYLEEYIEQIIMEEFQEDEFEQLKLEFIKDKLKTASSTKSDWSGSYNTGKWAIRYLEMMEKRKASRKQIEEFCNEYWENSSVRRYYINLCVKNKEYDKALGVLDESIVKDKDYRGLVSDYSKKKRDIYHLQGNTEAYIKELWKLELDYEAGNLEIFRELKMQYIPQEWEKKREEIFKKLPKYANVEVLYKEEKLYDRLLEYVIHSPGLYAVQEYENVLIKEYPEQILQKYEEEVKHMASFTSDRKRYQQIVAILRRMRKIKGGSKLVEEIVTEWKYKYGNRPAMMDELRKL